MVAGFVDPSQWEGVVCDGNGRYWNQSGSAKFTTAGGDFSTEQVFLA